MKPVDSVVALVPKDVQGSTLTDAVYNDYPPEMFLKDGKLVGIQVDLANAAIMGMKLDNKAAGSFDSIIPGIAGKKYDLASSDFGVTAERVKQVDFVTLFDLGTSFGVKSGSGVAIDKRSELCGLSIGVIAGSYFVPQVEDVSKESVADGDKAIRLQAHVGVPLRRGDGCCQRRVNSRAADSKVWPAEGFHWMPERASTSSRSRWSSS